MIQPKIFLFLITFFIPAFGRLQYDTLYAPAGDTCITNQCFYQPPEECPKPENKCRCQKLPSCERAAICCNVNSFYIQEGLACANISLIHLEALHIRNATMETFNFENLKRMKYLKYITVTDGTINSVTGEFAKHTVVSCLNMSSNGIVNFEDRSLVNLYNLTFLDLSFNNLSDVPRFKKEGNVTLDISANKQMFCTNLFDALKRTELHFRNENNTFCSLALSFDTFNSTESVSLSQVIEQHEIRKSCHKNCSCEPARIDFVPGNVPTFKVVVNCSGQSLLTLPTPLPPNTITLIVSNNNITSLDLLSTDCSYESVKELYADNNQITSILPLEGSPFMSNFIVLSLRNNKLKSLPTYVFSNDFDRIQGPNVKLGLNKLQCDCNTAKVLKVWLLAKQKYIRDYEEIVCENMDLKVMELNPSKLCQTHQDWTDYIYYIITAEVLLLVGLIAKVVYDYCVFKTTGYLPWPASKMPKLPCDWLCE